MTKIGRADRRLALLVLLSACGRVAFDERGSECVGTCWDAETGDLSQWMFVDDTTIVPGNKSRVSLSGAVVHDGWYSFAFDVNNDPWSYGCFVRHEWPAIADLYVRFYLYLPTPSDGAMRPGWRGRLYVSNAGHIFGFQVGADGLPDRWVVQTGNGMINWGQNGVTVHESTKHFSLDSWHAIELRMVSESAAGGTELWVDGDLAVSDLGIDLSDASNASCYLGAVYWTNDGGTFVEPAPVGAYRFFIDTVQLDTVPIGP